MAVTNRYRVLTPESVEFDYELGGLASRMLAAAIDHLIIFLALGAIWLIVLIIGLASMLVLGLPMAALGRIAAFLVTYAYFVVFEWRSNGQTPGKRFMDLRVIDDRGMDADLLQCLIRNLFRGVDMLPILAIPGIVSMPMEFLGMSATGFYAVGGVIALISGSQKRLGDWAGGTLVVRKRKGIMPEAVIAPNEKYNSIQDDPVLRRRIRALLSLEERDAMLQLCLRRNELEFDSRQALFSDAALYLQHRLDIEREPFLSEEKFVQNIVAVALSGAAPPASGVRSPARTGGR